MILDSLFERNITFLFFLSVICCCSFFFFNLNYIPPESRERAWKNRIIGFSLTRDKFSSSSFSSMLFPCEDAKKKKEKKKSKYTPTYLHGGG